MATLFLFTDSTSAVLCVNRGATLPQGKMKKSEYHVRHMRRSWLLCSTLALALQSQLALADAEAAKTKAQEVCSGCHGQHGNPVAPQIPILAGQLARYLYVELRDFKVGRRNDPIMSRMSEGLTKQEMLDLADYFAAQEPAAALFAPDRERVLRGAKKLNETLCTMCHLGGLKGQNEIPRLAGQQPEYVINQLRAFKSRERTNDGGNMQSVAQTLSDEDIIDLSHYIADLR